LGVKQLSTNPWDSLEKALPIGTIVHGTVTKTTASAAFVQLDSGIEALIHVTELSDHPFGKVEDVFLKRQNHSEVIKIDSEHKKVALSIKEYLIEQNQQNREILQLVQKRRKGKKKETHDVE